MRVLVELAVDSQLPSLKLSNPLVDSSLEVALNIIGCILIVPGQPIPRCSFLALVSKLLLPLVGFAFGLHRIVVLVGFFRFLLLDLLLAGFLVAIFWLISARLSLLASPRLISVTLQTLRLRFHLQLFRFFSIIIIINAWSVSVVASRKLLPGSSGWFVGLFEFLSGRFRLVNFTFGCFVITFLARRSPKLLALNYVSFESDLRLFSD